MENSELSERRMVLNEETRYYLSVSAAWGMFIAIVGYIGVVLMLLMGVAMFFLNGFSNAVFQTIPTYVLGVFYFLLGIIYYFPISYLYRFSKSIKSGLHSDGESELTEGFRNLKKMFKFIGVFTIVALSVYALVLVAVIPALIFFRA
jgi:hypothetical protein